MECDHSNFQFIFSMLHLNDSSCIFRYSLYFLLDCQKALQAKLIRIQRQACLVITSASTTYRLMVIIRDPVSKVILEMLGQQIEKVSSSEVSYPPRVLALPLIYICQCLTVYICIGDLQFYMGSELHDRCSVVEKVNKLKYLGCQTMKNGTLMNK